MVTSFLSNAHLAPEALCTLPITHGVGHVEWPLVWLPWGGGAWDPHLVTWGQRFAGYLTLVGNAVKGGGSGASLCSESV